MSEIEKPSDDAAGQQVEKEPRLDDEEAAVGAILKHADRNDADEDLKVLQGLRGETIILTPEIERKLLRKIDYNMMPLLCIVYGLNYLDKTTVSYASVMGLKVGGL